MNLLIRNGIVVNANASGPLDIRCRGGKIEETGNMLEPGDQEKIIDATGCLVFPGGIDPHVHLQLPTLNGRSSDDFYTGSVAAAMGGTTTLIDFVTPEKGQALSEAIKLRKLEAEKSILDHSFHVSPVEWRPGMEEEIKVCVEKEGLRSFKAYMAYKKSIGLEDNALFQVMESVAASEGVLLVHCELGDEIETLRERFGNEGKTGPRYHGLSRPAILEAKAVERLVNFVEKTQCAVYIVHVSSHLTLDVIKKARAKGLPVYAETCPQYLLLTDDKYELKKEEAVKYIMSPPLRKKVDNESIWAALSTGIIQTVGTDHCPFSYDQKMAGINDFRNIPNGGGGVEHRIALLYSYGVLKNKISLQQFVTLTSTNAAKIFGLFPQKGAIAEGSDADLVIWDPELQRTISFRNHHQNCDFNIYEGFPVTGGAKYVIANGRVLVDQGVFSTKKVRGRFLQTHPV